MRHNQRSWTSRAYLVLLLLICIAIGAHVIYALLVPLLPVIIVGIVLVAVYGFIFRR